MENWPGDYGVSGADLADKVYRQMEKMGAKIEYEEVLAVEKVGDGAVVAEDVIAYLNKK